jgi:hypothetical protein
MRCSIHKLILVVILCWAVPLAAQNVAAPDATEPDPSLTPGQVITIQLDALRKNRDMANNAGIAITFSFASPANRRMTGPLPRFIQMLKNPLYTIMLDFDRYETGKIEREGDNAQQRVTLIDAKGNKAIFLWLLSKQKQAPYENCWMTDSVHRVNPDHEKPLVAKLALPDRL